MKIKLGLSTGIDVGKLGVQRTGGIVDTTSPTVTITCSQSSPSATTPLNFTFTFSETVTGFTVGDITVGNGSAGNFAGSGAVYTADITPTGMSVVTVDVGAGVCVDASNNSNTAATQFTITSTAAFTDSFDRANGDLANGWTYTAGKWVVSGNAAVATPGLGSSITLNSGFASGANWIIDNPSAWAIGSGVATRTPGGGNEDIYQNVATTNLWYRYDFDITSYTAGNVITLRLNDYNFYAAAGSFVDTGRQTSTSAGLTSGGTGNLSIDNLTVKAITFPDTFCVRNFPVADIDISIPLSQSKIGVDNGIVARLDSTSNPKYFIIAYYSGKSIMLDKCVNGTYTNLIAQTTTYGAGQILRLDVSGTDVAVYYNGSQISTTKTVSDAGIVNNTIHGMFATAPEGSLASFTANP